MTIKEKLIDFLKMLLWKNKTELIIFCGLLLLYLPYSIFISYYTSIIDHPTIDADLYFSYDNPLILRNGRANVAGHPLLMFFYYPFVVLGNLLAMVAGLKAKTILFIFVSSTAISMSCVYVYRYLREIVELGLGLGLFITLSYALFSTNLILAFTPESFTLVTVFLAFNVYFYAYYLKEERTPSLFSSSLLTNFFLGGVTLTHFAKGVIPILFVKETFWFKIKRIFTIGVIFFIILILLQIVLIFVAQKDYYESIRIHKTLFTYDIGSMETYFRKVFHHFFGSPIFFPQLEEYTFFNDVFNITEHQIKETDYTQWWQFSVLASLVGIVVLSIARNIKNKFVLTIALLLSVDIFIHCIILFGLSWPFMYGAHWVYCIPLLLGWLIKSFKGWQRTAFSVFSVVLFVVIGINNIAKLLDFITIARDMFPPIS